jgi:hypothetical protein
MKITIEQYEEKFTYESSDDSMVMSELTEKLYGLCIAAGYHPDSVGECFYDKGQEMTAHLFPEDNVDCDEETSLEFDEEERVEVKSRYSDNRKFKRIAMNCIEYSFKDDGHIGCSRNEDGSLHSVDPSGGPYIGIETDLGVVDSSLRGLIVTKIKAAPTIGGVYYLTVKKDNA